MSTGEQQPSGWNPYQQAGYHQENPYQQPTVPFDQAGGGVPPNGPGPDRAHRTKMALAVAASVIMVAAVTTGGVILVADSDTSDGPVVAQPSDDETDPETDGEDEPDGEGDGDGDDRPSDPRDRGLEDVDPVVAEDWQVQAHPERQIAYDVPPERRMLPVVTFVSWNVDLPNDDGELEETQFPVRGATVYQDEFCGSGSSRAVAGVTGSLGSPDTEQAAVSTALNYVLAAFDHEQQGTRTDVPPEPFSNDQGLEGTLAISTVEGFPVENEECHSPSGKAIAVSYVSNNGDILVWLLVMDTGVDDEVDQETIDKMLGSLRPYDPS